mgnify:CR=1 FL=1
MSLPSSQQIQVKANKPNLVISASAFSAGLKQDSNLPLVQTNHVAIRCRPLMNQGSIVPCQRFVGRVTQPQVTSSFSTGATLVWAGKQDQVEIITVKLQTTSPPTDAVQDAFQEVNRARQKKEQVVNEALGERNFKIPAARGARDRAIAEAEGYQNRVILQTMGEVNAFLAQLAEYEKAPDVTRRRLYLEAMEEVLTRVGRKIIIDESVRGVVPLLNLDQGGPPPVIESGGGR